MAIPEELKPGPKSPEEMREEIARTRDELASSIVGLKREVSETTDWRAWVRRNPALFIGGAFLLGAVLGSRR